MVEEAFGNIGAVLKEASAGYYSARSVEELQALGVDPFLRRRRPATARNRNRRPGAGSPGDCRPGTG